MFKKKNKRFPTFWVIVLVFAVFWALDELKILVINIPWLPVILIIIAVGAIVNHYQGK